MFIYVMGSGPKKILEEHGYKLLKSDEGKGLYCFADKPDMQFDLDVKYGIQCVISSIMTF